MVKLHEGKTLHKRSENPEGHADKWSWVTFKDGDVIPDEKCCKEKAEKKQIVKAEPVKKSRAAVLKDKTVVELKAILKKFGVTGYSRLNEDELIKEVIKAEKA